jgi:hypothetical protein
VGLVHGRKVFVNVVGIIENQPIVRDGVLDISALEKAARFVRTCDAFNVPLITWVDVPGFLPGVEQEHGGIIRHGATLLYAYCEANVPRIQVILRKTYGGAYIVMDSRSIGADLSLAWLANEIAVMGPEAAADVVFRRELADASNPAELRRSLGQRYTEELTHPYYAAECGYVDDVIDPADTQRALVDGLAMLRTKRPRCSGASTEIPHCKGAMCGQVSISHKPLVSAAIAAEVREIVCELWELQSFEITPTSVLARYHDGPEVPVEMLATTLELAFGVTIEPGDAATMVNLEKVLSSA